jgi:hypothetical protein
VAPSGPALAIQVRAPEINKTNVRAFHVPVQCKWYLNWVKGVMWLHLCVPKTTSKRINAR